MHTSCAKTIHKHNDPAVLGRNASGCGQDQHGGAPGLSFGPVHSFGQLCEAFHLVYMQYLASGYQIPNSAKMRYGFLQLLPTSRTFVAMLDSRVIGTGTVVLSSAAGLPSGGIFGEAFSALERAGRRVAEATMLACIGVEGKPAHSTSLELIPWGVSWALANGADDWCIVVNPRHLRFWQRTLGLETLGEALVCDHVRGHPGILLRLPLREIKAGTAEVTPALGSWVLGRLPISALSRSHQLTTEEVAVLLIQNPELLSELTEQQKTLVERRYPTALRLAEASAAVARVSMAA